VTEAESAGVVATGEAAGADDSAAAGAGGGDSSCAKEIAANSRPDTTASRMVISVENKSSRFELVGQADRCFCATKIPRIVDLV